jgi:hypothetical protein
MPDSNQNQSDTFALLNGAGESDGGDGDHGSLGYQDPLEGAEAIGKKSRVNEGVVLLVVVLAIASGVLLIMRQTGKASLTGGLSSVELQIEKALTQMSGINAGQANQPGDTPLPTTEQVVAMFSTDPAAKQVKLAELKFNPFALRVTTRLTEVAVDPVSNPGPSVEDRRAKLRAQELRDELGKLELQTVMKGRVPMALVSGEVVRERAKLGSFTVVAIEPMAVILAADGNTYRLTMEQPANEKR